MTDNLLQKLEEKIMSLLTEVDVLRKDISRLKLENATLTVTHTDYSKKVQELVSLLDIVEIGHSAHVHEAATA